MSLNGHASSMLMHTGTRVPPPPAGRPLLCSAAWWEGGEVGGAWRARESQPERQVVLQTRIAQGREGALTRLQVSATLEGLVCEGDNDEGFV